jgi:hypothetical protein
VRPRDLELAAADADDSLAVAAGTTGAVDEGDLDFRGSEIDAEVHG